jgi:fimbrial chaperone protein
LRTARLSVPIFFGVPIVVTVSIPGATASSYEIECLTWDQVGDTDKQEPTEDIVASPPVATIQPGESQVVRLILRRPARAEELAYRLAITELPAPGAAARAQVGFAIVSSLPVFVVPNNARPGKLEWRAERVAGGGLDVVARNSGGRTLRLGALSVAGPAGRAVTAQPRGAIVAVQPGLERRWTVPAAAAAGLGGRLKLSGSMQGTAFEEAVSFTP